MCLALVLLVAFAPAVFAQAISGIVIETPRQFGYVIGDRIRHEMQLSLREPFRLDLASLPESGRLDRWLAISAATATRQDRDDIVVYRIGIDYQIVNAPRELTAVTIPQLEFLVVGGPNPLPVFLQEWTFSIGPIAEAGPRPELLLRADRRPQPIPVGGRIIRLWIDGLLLAGLLGYLAWWRWLLPRLKRGRYPFSGACGELRRLLRPASTADDYKLGLRAFHAAVNAAAGHVVFIDNLHEFLESRPEYAGLQAELAALYARSRDVFFNNAPIEAPALSLRELVELCRRCRTLERSVA